MVVQSNASVSAIASVDLKPQLNNPITAVHVQEGQMVKSGQLLFELDARNEQANLQKAQAQLQKDQAQLDDLKRQLKRSDELLAKNFVSKGASDTLTAQVAAQEATLRLDQAALASARIALDYTRIRAPMDGRVGAINVYPGSMAQTGVSLLQITRLDPIDVSFSAPESQLPALMAAYKAGQSRVEVQAAGSTEVLQGKLSFIDNAIDPQSGMIRVKARFANPQQTLWPGQFAQARLFVSTLKDAVVVPQAALVMNARGRSVYTVEADQSAKQRPVSLLYSYGQMAVISGLSGGEKVIVDGKQNLRPGNKVKEMPSAQSGGKDGGKDGKAAAAASTAATPAPGKKDGAA